MSVRNKGHRSTFMRERLIAFLLIISSLASLPSCRKVTSSFPSIEETSSETTQTVPTTNGTEASTYTLSIASPLSYNTCVYLAKLYFLKSTGALGEGVNGENITLDYLDSINLPFALNVYSTSETGCNTDTLKQWKENGDMPDIFLTDSFDLVVQEGYARPVTKQLSDETLLSPSYVYMPLVEQFYVNNDFYGIPFQATAHVMFADMEVLGKAGINETEFKQDRKTFDGMLSSLMDLNMENMEVLPFYLAQSLIPYLPVTCYGAGYGYCADSKTRNSKPWRESLSYLKSVVSSGYAYESLDQETIDLLFQGMSPLLSRKVGIWAGSTDMLSIYDNYMPNTLVMMQIPSMEQGQSSPALITVYPLCISSTCEHTDEAVRFASFISLDEDALLLASRLDQREGFLPVVSSSSLWKNVVSTQKYGSYLLQYQPLMPDAVCIPSVTESVRYKEDMKYIESHLDELIVEKQVEEETE